MEIANCEVRLLGSIQNSVPRLNITPAEAAILREIHGSDSVVRVQAVGADRRPHKDEYERLAAKYGSTTTEDGTKIFYKLFPQSFDPKLPVSFKDVGIDLIGGSHESVPDLPDAPDEADADAPAVEEIQPKRRRKSAED